MRYALTMEAIGDNYAAHQRHALRYPTTPLRKRELNSFRLGNTHLVPWVAKIRGTDSRYDFVREFLHGQKDYSKANSTGSRGIFLHYFLEPGIYEINHRTTWSKARRYFARVVDHRTLLEISREEVLRCLP